MAFIKIHFVLTYFHYNCFHLNIFKIDLIYEKYNKDIFRKSMPNNLNKKTIIYFELIFIQKFLLRYIENRIIL